MFLVDYSPCMYSMKIVKAVAFSFSAQQRVSSPLWWVMKKKDRACFYIGIILNSTASCSQSSFTASTTSLRAIFPVKAVSGAAEWGGNSQCMAEIRLVIYRSPKKMIFGITLQRQLNILRRHKPFVWYISTVVLYCYLHALQLDVGIWEPHTLSRTHSVPS